jgi:transglutaminase-like putative cysteine protease
MLVRLVLVVLCLIAAPLRAAEVPAVPVPDWVEALPLPELPRDLYRHVQDGQAFRLLDRQIAWRGGRRLTYVRIAVEAVNRAGLERVATVARDWDPQVETLSLVHLDLVRGGDRRPLADRLTPTVLRRETRLDAGIIDGTLTAHYDVPGVAVGDVVDAAFLWVSGEYLPGMGREVSLDLEFDVPVGDTRLLVTWDGLPPRIRAPETLRVPASDPRRLEWRRPARAPEPREGGEADPGALYDSVSLTAHADWEAVSAPLTAHFAAPRPPPEAWLPRLAAIRAAEATDVGRAYAALRLVQQEIRYVGLEVGAGGYFARPPEQVVAQGFGDCKDKALLLKVMLEALGLEAQVALARLEGGHALDRALPQATAFDHMIAAVRLDGRWVFMDPTRTYEGGVGATALEPDLGLVLPVSAGRDALVPIEADRRPRWFRRMTEVFTFTPAGARLEVETLLRGDSAAAERETWDTRPVGEIARGYLDYYGALYPGIEPLSDPVFADAPRQDEVTVRESYLIPRVALHAPALWRDFPFVSEFSYAPYPPPGPRRAALAIPHRARIEHRVVVHGAPVSFEPPPDAALDTPAFSARFSGRAPRAGDLVLDWVYETLSRSVSAPEAQVVTEAAERARELRSYSWDLGDTVAGPDWWDRLLDGLASPSRP